MNHHLSLFLSSSLQKETKVILKQQKWQKHAKSNKHSKRMQWHSRTKRANQEGRINNWQNWPVSTRSNFCAWWRVNPFAKWVWCQKAYHLRPALVYKNKSRWISEWISIDQWLIWQLPHRRTSDSCFWIILGLGNCVRHELLVLCHSIDFIASIHQHALCHCAIACVLVKVQTRRSCTCMIFFFLFDLPEDKSDS